ncbi:anaerobic nitric oxide reductase flavorubredoxin [Candidatus Margulisiibacteriota bacterium]
MKIPIKNNIFWIGKTDWELRKFHGSEYSTHKGSTYNSYLIQEEKSGIIDTVWAPYAKEYVHNLQQEIDLSKIDFIIANHAEIDHSGALPELMKLIPEVPIYCTNNGLKSIKGHFHKEWNVKTVKTGDSLEIGNNKKLIFIEAPMLHWPDTMMCYLTEDNILFSNDAFGQHYANEYLFNDLVDQDELYKECIKYYANILNPFSQLVTKKIKEILNLKLPVDSICPSHGVVWRTNPIQIVEKYLEWADQYNKNQITIIYDSMWGGTKILAENIAKGITTADKKVNVKLFNIASSDKNDVITEIFKSKAILLGSPTINNGILSAVAGLIEEIKGLKFKNKKAAAFGCYGWSGESVNIMTKALKDAGFDIFNEGIKAFWNPDDDSKKRCLEFGNKIAVGG